MAQPILELLPAVDISEGYAVRPVGGTLSGGERRLDPVEAALTWVEAGTDWIHLVDLDLAFGAVLTPRFWRRLSPPFVPARLNVANRYVFR